MISTGNKIIAENEVEDPAGYISEKLAASLAEENALTQIRTEGVIASGTKAAELAEQYSNSNLLLDVQTINWSFVYFPSDFDNYPVIYSAKVRLIDTKAKKLLAEGFCARVPEKTASARRTRNCWSTRRAA